ncbi:toll/interleukin-1 receptor domain-containing protein [Pseudonocardia sp. DSM 45834]|uniref:Toll/interleukin-1 receptor domain-containing protein n=1 Tax=Pseudonocardia charpentierae TaxID=3075545 RepID=A0ABU2NBA7_9PSEU|nr:toll/interleukin-1 receptor domain-containing protein [Pseudonocardia sp. DSM 45834]
MEVTDVGELEIRVVNFSFSDADGVPRRVAGSQWAVSALPPTSRRSEPERSHAPPRPRGKVFISYRREDAQELANYLYVELSREFGPERVFLDRSRRQLGVDFRVRLKAELESSTAMLVVIGPAWNPLIKQEEQTRRLDLQRDHVRYEIRTGLQLEIPVIPVLFRKVDMPKPEELPEDLRGLSFFEKSEIHDTRFEADIREIVDALRPYVGLQ